MKRNLGAGRSQSGGFSLNTFNTDELNESHLATLEVLEKTGLFVEDEEAMAIFDGGGAFVDSFEERFRQILNKKFAIAKQ